MNIVSWIYRKVMFAMAIIGLISSVAFAYARWAANNAYARAQNLAIEFIELDAQIAAMPLFDPENVTPDGEVCITLTEEDYFFGLASLQKMNQLTAASRAALSNELYAPASDSRRIGELLIAISAIENEAWMLDQLIQHGYALIGQQACLELKPKGVPL